MGRADYFELGDWNVVCSMCGRKRKASAMARNWQGMYRCPDHNEARQPQDFVRTVPDNMTAPWVQKPIDQFVIIQCDFNGSSAIPGVAVPGCAIPGRHTLI